MRPLHLTNATPSSLSPIVPTQKLGGTVSDTELVPGMALNQKALNAAGGPTAMKDARIGLIQYQLSPPKATAPETISPFFF